jgi:hyperosmotically inducible protein
MKAVIGTLIVGAALIVTPLSTSAAFAQAPATTTATADRNLDNRIEKKLHNDATLKKYNIDVAVANGVATLTGTVPTEADRAKAGQMANEPGITRVDNQLIVDLIAGVKGTAGKVEQKTKEGAEKTKQGADKAWEKTKEGAGTVADKTKEGVSKTGEVITDGWITTRVKSKFVGEDLLKGSDINVDTDNHVVTLKGTVPSAAARARAVAEAKEVEGVHKVVDQLTIGPKK